MAKGARVRVAFRLTGDPDTPLVSGGWRIWTHAEDTYVTAKSLRDTWKVSLHADAHWASAVTAENARREDTVLPPGHDRAMSRFEPTAFVDGRRDAFAIGVLRNALLPGVPNPNETIVEVDDRWDVLSLVMVRMTEPGVVPASRWDVIADPLPLESGRQVWVTQAFDAMGQGEREPQATGALIRPMTPGVQDVTCPGWLVTGLRLG